MRWRGFRFVDAHDIANGINAHLVKPALVHFLRDKRSAGAVCIGEVSDRELAFLQVARVAVLRQLFMPVPGFMAKCGLYAELVIQTDFNDAVDIAQAFTEFMVGVVAQPSLEGGDDLLPG